MIAQYRGLDRSTRTTIFLASLLVTISLLSSVTAAFGPAAVHAKAADGIAEVVIQG
jgi:hypothetical protein